MCPSWISSYFPSPFCIHVDVAFILFRHSEEHNQLCAPLKPTDPWKSEILTDCLSDIKSWMAQNVLKLNNDTVSLGSICLVPYIPRALLVLIFFSLLNNIIQVTKNQE